MAPPRVAQQVIQEIERRRSFLPKGRDLTLAQNIDRLERAARASVRRETALQAAWRQVAPPEIAAKARPASLRSGALTLGVDDQAAKYLVDRWLRGSGRASLAAALGAAITRVVIKVGQ